GYNAVTIHRLLEAELADDGFTVYFRRNQNNPLELDAIIIDEGSMLDVRLMACLMDAVKKGTRIIIAGDKNQLPPVGAGNVLKDIIKSDTIPCYYLTQIYRQEKESKIVYNAHMIQEGTVPKDGGSDSDFLIYETKNHKELEKVIYDLIEQNEEYIIDSLKYQVITMTKKGPFGTVALNEKIQEKLNPMGETKKQLMEGDKIFREGDKVMQIKNNYGLKYRSFEDLTEGQGIFNGEIGIIKAVDPDRLTLDVLFSDTYYVVYEGDDLGQLELAYAITVHKSQGSEFGTIIMPLIYASKNLMTRNLIYTALTRAKDKAILVGSLKALEEMVENTREDNRNTCLSVMLQGGEDEDSGAP
ncbi:MAG: AAA family ATPase, partial [Clostridiales bacterium]|nr:AAA family ATPase [Clostridiales bacterium]